MKKTFVATLLVVALAATVVAQEERHPGPSMACPHPVQIVIRGESHPPTPDAGAFGPTLFPLVKASQWNQTAINKAFGTTFHFPAQPKECCVMTKGTLVVTLKALEGGGPNSSTSWNDDIVVFNGTDKFYNKRVWPQTGTVKTGETETLTIPIPANVLATGFFNLYVEDDTAVVSAVLTLEGCCLK